MQVCTENLQNLYSKNIHLNQNYNFLPHGSQFEYVRKFKFHSVKCFKLKLSKNVVETELPTTMRALHNIVVLPIFET